MSLGFENVPLLNVPFKSWKETPIHGSSTLLILSISEFKYVLLQTAYLFCKLLDGY